MDKNCKSRCKRTDRSALETKLRAESNLPAVMRSVRENNLVANIGSQSDGAKICYDSASRIKSRAHVIRSEVVDTARKTGEGSRSRIETEICEAAFYGDENANGSRGLNLWTEQPMKDFYVGILRGDRAISVVKSFGERTAEIVSHFRLDLHVRCNVKRGPSAQSDEIGFSLLQPKVVHECADLSMVVVLGARDWSKSQADGGDCDQKCYAFHCVLPLIQIRVAVQRKATSFPQPL